MIYSSLLLGIAVFIFIRNYIVSKARYKAIFIITENGGISWCRFYKGQSYDSQMFDLRKWTFKQFYPWLV